MAQDSKVLWSFRFLPNWTQFHFISRRRPLPSPPSPPLHIYVLCSYLSFSSLLFCILVDFLSSPKKPQKVNKSPLELLFCSRVTSLSLKYRSSSDRPARSWFGQFIPLREHKIRDTFAVNGQWHSSLGSRQTFDAGPLFVLGFSLNDCTPPVLFQFLQMEILTNHKINEKTWDVQSEPIKSLVKHCV